MGDFTRSFGEFYKAFFGKKPSSWQDKVIATETALRSLLLVGCVVYRNPQNPRDAAIKGGAVWSIAYQQCVGFPASWRAGGGGAVVVSAMAGRRKPAERGGKGVAQRAFAIYPGLALG